MASHVAPKFPFLHLNRGFLFGGDFTTSRGIADVAPVGSPAHPLARLPWVEQVGLWRRPAAGRVPRLEALVPVPTVLLRRPCHVACAKPLRRGHHADCRPPTPPTIRGRPPLRATLSWPGTEAQSGLRGTSDDIESRARLARLTRIPVATAEIGYGRWYQTPGLGFEFDEKAVARYGRWSSVS